MPQVPQLVQIAQGVDTISTELAQGFSFPDPVADRIFTPVKVDKAFGIYNIWDQSTMVVESSLRAAGAQANRSTAKFTYGKWALPIGYTREVALDWRIDEFSKGNGQVNLSKQQLYVEREKMELEKEDAFAQLITNVASYNVTFTPTVPWDQTTADIKKDVLAAKLSMLNRIGVYPDLLLLSPDVLNAVLTSGSIQKYFLNTNAAAAVLDPDDDNDMRTLAKALGVKEVIQCKSQKIDPSTKVRTAMYGTGFAALVKRGTIAGNGVIDPTALPPGMGYLLRLTGHPYVDSYEDISRTSLVYRVNDNFVYVQTSKDACALGQSVLS